MVHPVQVGKRTRMSFGKVKDVTEMPNLIEVQLDSYQWFLKEGLHEVFDDINPITNFTGNLVLEFVDYKLDMDNIKYSVEECKERDATFAAPLKVKVRLYNKEKEEIIHAIEAHHNDVEPRTVVACLVQAADAISAARPGARRENIENYIKRLEKLEEITSSYPGVETSYAIQAGREVRVMVKPEQVSEDDMVILARELAKRIESELEYPGQIKVHVLRETKVIEYAK